MPGPAPQFEAAPVAMDRIAMPAAGAGSFDAAAFQVARTPFAAAEAPSLPNVGIGYNRDNTSFKSTPEVSYYQSKEALAPVTNRPPAEADDKGGFKSSNVNTVPLDSPAAKNADIVVQKGEDGKYQAVMKSDLESSKTPLKDYTVAMPPDVPADVQRKVLEDLQANVAKQGGSTTVVDNSNLLNKDVKDEANENGGNSANLNDGNGCNGGGGGGGCNGGGGGGDNNMDRNNGGKDKDVPDELPNPGPNPNDGLSGSQKQALNMMNETSSEIMSKGGMNPEITGNAFSRFFPANWMNDIEPPITPEKLAKYMKDHAAEIQKNIDAESGKLSAAGDTEGATALNDLKGRFDPNSAGFQQFSESLTTPMNHLQSDAKNGTHTFDAADAKTVFNDAQQKAITNRVIQEHGMDLAGVDLNRKFPPSSDKAGREAAVKDQTTKLSALEDALINHPEKVKDPFHKTGS